MIAVYERNLLFPVTVLPAQIQPLSHFWSVNKLYCHLESANDPINVKKGSHDKLLMNSDDESMSTLWSFPCVSWWSDYYLLSRLFHIILWWKLVIVTMCPYLIKIHNEFQVIESEVITQTCYFHWACFFLNGFHLLTAKTFPVYIICV